MGDEVSFDAHYDESDEIRSEADSLNNAQKKGGESFLEPYRQREGGSSKLEEDEGRRRVVETIDPIDPAVEEE